jgi:hypothetical protein
MVRAIVDLVLTNVIEINALRLVITDRSPETEAAALQVARARVGERFEPLWQRLRTETNIEEALAACLRDFAGPVQ